MKNKKRTLWLGFDRALSHDLGKQVLILLGMLFVIFCLSFVLLNISSGDWKAYCNENHLNKFFFPLYLLIDGNTFHDLYSKGYVRGWTLILSSLIYVAGVIVFTGMIIAAMTNMIARRVERHRDGLIHYLKSGHYVIMGYDEMVPSIITEIFNRNPNADVLLLTAVDAKIIHERLLKSVARKQMDQIFINYGQRTAKEYYKDIYLEAASEIFIVGKRSLPAHDAINVECVDSICDYLKEIGGNLRPKRITCVFEDLDTYAAFKTSEIFQEVRELGMEFVPYNFYAGWAKQVFFSQSYKEKRNPSEAIAYPSIYGKGITPEDKNNVHLVFVGTTNFAVSFAMEAAHMLHFPNFKDDNGRRTRITFIDLNADKERDLFVTRNRHYFDIQSYYYRDYTDLKVNEPNKTLLSKDFDIHDFLDVEFEFIKGDVFSQEVQNEISQWAADENQYLSIFLAMADQRNNFIMGMNMPDEVYDHGVPVFVRQDRADNFVTNLRKVDQNKQKYAFLKDGKLKVEDRKGRYANLYPFGMDDMAYCSEEKALRMAKLINYLYNKADYTTYRFPDSLILDITSEKEIWQDAEKFWKTLSVAHKWSNLYCSYSIPCKLASLRAMRGLEPDDTSHDLDALTDEEIREIATVEHNRWNVEKLLMGYRKAHPKEDKYEKSPEDASKLKKNKNLFIHHDIRPFDKLDAIKQMDFEIARCLPWIVRVGMQNG
jgi:hypothetical protein